MSLASKLFSLVLSACLFLVTAPTVALAAQPGHIQASYAESRSEATSAAPARTGAAPQSSKAFSETRGKSYAEREQKDGALAEYHGGGAVVIGVSTGVVIAVLAVVLIIVLVRN